MLHTLHQNAFKEGRFEAKIRMPIFNYSHSTFWLWQQNNYGEIDVAEGYGDPYWTNRRSTCEVHDWAGGNHGGGFIFLMKTLNMDRFSGVLF